MRKVLFITVVVAVCGCFAVAQDYPKASIFGGFSYLHADTEGATPATLGVGFPAGSSFKHWYPGWEVAAQFNLTRMLGFKADFSGNYGTPLMVPGFALPSGRTYSFLFGPVVSVRRDRLTPFVHALFGGNHIGVDASPVVLETPAFSETAFAMAFGGGLDVKLTRHFAARLGQFDYLYTKHCFNLPSSFGGFAVVAGCQLGGASGFADHQNNFRFATGIVITP